MKFELAADKTYIRAGALDGFVDLVRSRGGDPLAMLKCAGIDPASLTSPDMLISFTRKGHLLEMAAAELDMPSLGLEWALALPAYYPNSGPMLLLGKMTRTIGEWIDQSTRYWRLQTNGQVPMLVDDGVSDRVAIRMSTNSASPPRQQVEYIVATLYRVLQAVAGADMAISVTIRFRHSKPDDISVHEQVFGSEPQFDADHDELVFDRSSLALPISDHLPSPQAIMNQFIRHRIRQMPRYHQAVSTTTEIAIRTLLGCRLCTKEYVARTLGISATRLQHLLAREGTSFGDILDAVRQDVACGLLAQTAVPAATIAGLLDYASAPALTLAMKRWTGMTPGAYRSRAQGIDDIDQEPDDDG